MKLAKTLAIVACAGLLSTGMPSWARYAYAQDADQTDQNGGGWGADSTDNTDLSSPAAKAPPLDITGCWSGEVQDTAHGVGLATFHFVQSASGKKLVKGSSFDFFWNSKNFAFGPDTGSVSPGGVKFHGNAGKGCPVHGTLMGNGSALTGSAKFGGECAKAFKNVLISISPGCI